MIVVSGWGALSNGGGYPDPLQVVDLPTVSVEGKGKITSPQGIDCGTDCSEFFPPGNSAQVAMQAVPDAGWV